MSKENKIKREDVISDEALNWGDEYAKKIKKAIKVNKRLQKSIHKTRKILRGL